MKEIGMDELKRLQVEILLKVHQFCQDNGIEYSLDSGTLLGAVRHKGYIPWDDDIDIIMPRPHYDKFIKSFNGCFDDLYVMAPELNWNYYAPYANVCDRRTLLLEESMGHNNMEIGVKIDVFPVDACPDDYNSFFSLYSKSHRLLLELMSKRVKLRHYAFSNFRAFCGLSFWRLRSIGRSYSEIQKELCHLATSSDYDAFNHATIFVFLVGPLYLNKSVFESFVDMDFEGYKLRGIKNYDEYLTAMYGDYMRLPPENERVCHHGFLAYWK